MPTVEEIKRVQDEMAGRSQKWKLTNDANLRKQLEDENLAAGTAIGAKRNDAAGTWDWTGVKAEQAPKPDYLQQSQASIDQMMNADRAQRLQALQEQQRKHTAQLNQQKAEVKPMYQDKRNQASFQSAQSSQSFREAMANAGLFTSGERFNNQTGEGAQNIARENALNGLNLQEQQTMSDFDRRIADVNDPSQEAAIDAAINREKAQMLYDAQQKAKAMEYQTGRDQVTDNQWLTSQTGYFTDPAAQALADKIVGLKLGNPTGTDTAKQWEADVYRGQLKSQYGINADELFGSGVTAQQAQANLAKLRTPTLQKQQLDQQNTQFYENLGITKQELALKGQELAHKIGYDWAQLSQRDKEYLGQLAVSQQNANTSSGNLKLNQDELELRKTQDATKQTNQEATNRAVSEAIKSYDSYEQAIAALKQHAVEMQANGVDINAVLDSLQKRFGRVPSQSTQPNDPFSLGKD